jgi:lysyl-tRNA synthetase class 1
MAREVFRYPVPGRYEYEWIQIKGRGAMSSSKGIVLLPGDMLEIMAPDALRRMVLGRDPARALDLDLGAGFPRFMDEYKADTEDRPVPFAHLVTIAQTVGDNTDAAVDMLLQGGYKEAAADRAKLARDLSYARNWAEEWAPESLRFGVLELPEAVEAAKSLDEDQLRYLEEVAYELSKFESQADGDLIQNTLFAKAAELGLKPKKAFAAVYTVLLGKKSGPKAGPFIASIGVWLAQQRFLGVRADTADGGAEG